MMSPLFQRRRDYPGNAEEANRASMILSQNQIFSIGPEPWLAAKLGSFNSPITES
jgi:hypothetical protein